jgi:hypothetical protein
MPNPWAFPFIQAHRDTIRIAMNYLLPQQRPACGGQALFPRPSHRANAEFLNLKQCFAPERFACSLDVGCGTGQSSVG